MIDKGWYWHMQEGDSDPPHEKAPVYLQIPAHGMKIMCGYTELGQFIPVNTDEINWWRQRTRATYERH